MATLLEIAKRGRKRAGSLNSSDNPDNLDNVFRSLPRGRGGKGDCIRNKVPKKVCKVCRVITRDPEVELALDAFSGSPREPPELKAVFCRDCRNFTPNPLSPDCGLGSCGRRGPECSGRGQWPGAVNYCLMFSTRRNTVSASVDSG